MKTSNNIEHRRFSGKNGEAEHFFVVTAPGNISLKEQIQHIETNYAAKIKALGLHPKTAVFRRIFLSDALNQIETVRRSQLALDTEGHPVSVSIIQQPPLPYAKISLLAYHIESSSPLNNRRLSPLHVLVKKNGFGHLWSTRLCSQDTDRSLSTSAQTRNVFNNLIRNLSLAGGDLLHHCVRTWIYVRSIDSFYQDMVDERRALFTQQGLTSKTHFIASTGIEGAGTHRYDHVIIDAYSIIGLDCGQITFLNDFDKLCAAKDYNVTFERGTRINYADRAHYFISGTASIDNQGTTLFPGNVLKQLDRTLENINSLLKAGEASLTDMMYLIVYLRDPADFECVKEQLKKTLPLVPTIFVQAAVCRPEWLIEIEGVAIKSHDQPSYQSF